LQIGHGKYKIIHFDLNKKNKFTIIVKINKFQVLLACKMNPNNEVNWKSILFPKVLVCFTYNKSNYLIEYMLGPILVKFVKLIGINNLTKNTKNIIRIG